MDIRYIFHVEFQVSYSPLHQQHQSMKKDTRQIFLSALQTCQELSNSVIGISEWSFLKLEGIIHDCFSLESQFKEFCSSIEFRETLLCLSRSFYYQSLSEFFINLTEYWQEFVFRDYSATDYSDFKTATCVTEYCEKLYLNNRKLWSMIRHFANLQYPRMKQILLTKRMWIFGSCKLEHANSALLLFWLRRMSRYRDTSNYEVRKGKLTESTGFPRKN